MLTTVTWPLRHTTEPLWGQCQLLVKDPRYGYRGDFRMSSKSSGSSAWGSRMTARNKRSEKTPKHPKGLGCIHALRWKGLKHAHGGTKGTRCHTQLKMFTTWGLRTSVQGIYQAPQAGSTSWDHHGLEQGIGKD